MPLFLLFAFSCSHRTTPLGFSPEELPEATVGEQYHVRISVYDNDTPVYLMTAVSDSTLKGIIWDFNKEKGFAELKGVPEIPGKFEVTIKAFCHGTQKSGQADEKKYKLVVHDAESE